MASSQIPQTANQLGSEREKLLAAGLTDAEASQILFSRHGGGAQPAAPVVHPPLTGVASNLTAAAGYIGNFVPSMFADFSTMKNSALPSAVRTQAVGRLVMKIVVAYVIGYVLLLEFDQFRAATDRAKAEACNARQTQIVNTMPGFSMSKGFDYNSPQYKAWQKQHDEYDRDCAGMK